MTLHSFHEKLGARFCAVNGIEVAGNYGDVEAEYNALTETVAMFDLSFRSRVCLTGADQVKFLHGQVTNDVSGLAEGQGCYAALITAKGRMQSDLNIHRLPGELLLDFEPGLTRTVTERLEKYVISEDVQVTDVSELYGLLSVQGPKSGSLLQSLAKFSSLPEKPFAVVAAPANEGEIYLVNHARYGSSGYDLFLPVGLLASFAEQLSAAALPLRGRWAGLDAGEIARIEAGIPRFGADMDESNIPLEAGLENTAISFKKGCYIGQEVISRIRTYSEVAKSLRGLRLADDLKALPVKGDKLLKAGKEVGYVTSATRSPKLKANIALGYVRKETNQPGVELVLATGAGETAAHVVELPFLKPAK